MDGAWISLPETQDLAIRKFCPARVNQEHHHLGGEEVEDHSQIIDPSWSFDFNDESNTVDLEELVESFLNDDFQEFLTPSDLPGSLSTVDGETMEYSEATVSAGDDNQGLHLVHLLLACAEAVGCRDTQLADTMLSQIWPWTNPWGDSLRRVAHCFAAALESRLLLLRNNLNPTVDLNQVSKEEKSEAFKLFHQTTPYTAFGFMAANEAISQAAEGKDFLHIIDIGMEHTLQWVSLIRALAFRPNGPPKRLRITGMAVDNQIHRSDLQNLIDESQLLGVQLEVNLIHEEVSLSQFTREKLDIKLEETLFVNSIMHLHQCIKESKGTLKAILQAIKRLGPKIFTVVEQDANHNGPFFLGRFLESLHYYSAIFDSLEALLPRNSLQRMKIEKFHLAEEIKNIVAREGTDRVERHERADQWRRQLGRAGFQVFGLKPIMSQARMMLSVYGCDGYSLDCDKGCLLLGWKGRPIMLASAWQLSA